MRHRISILTAVFMLMFGTTTNAKDEPSFLKYEDCIFQVGVYGGIVTGLRDQGHDIPFSEVERSDRLMQILIDYGIRKYGEKKTLAAFQKISEPLGLRRAHAIGVHVKQVGITNGLAQIESRFRECEAIWQEDI